MGREYAEPEPIQDYLAPAVEWVAARGGCKGCAQSVLRMTCGDAQPSKVKAALEKAGAPVGVYGLIGAEIHGEAKRGPVEDEEPPPWWQR